MNYSLLTLLCIFPFVLTFQDEGGVLIATDSNINDIFKSYTYVLVDFYAPWCGHCQQMAPQYAAAARQVRSPDIQLVKVDCTANNVCQKFNIRGYPTLKLFVNGQYLQEYTGDRTHQAIVQWMFDLTSKSQQRQIADHKTGIPEENGVLVLDSNNFDQVVEQYEFLLVDFYAPWCGHCNDLAPIYAMAARQVRSSQVQLAKVDCTANQNICQRYSINGYPTLKFFNGPSLVVDYTGNRQVQDFVNWIKKKIQTGTQEYKDLDQMKQTVYGTQVVLVYFGNDKSEPEFLTYANYARKNMHLTTLHSFNPDFKPEFKVDSNTKLVLFKQFDDRKNLYNGNFSEGEIHQFVEQNQYPTIMNFDRKIATKVFANKEPTIFYLYSQNQASSQGEKQLRLSVSSIKSKIKICLANVNEHHGQRLTQFLKLQKESFPKVVVIEPEEYKVDKWILNKDITKQNIIEFVDNYKNQSGGKDDL